MAASFNHQVDILYTEHHSWLQRWLCKKLGCNHSAADLAQDTYVRVLVSGRVPPVEESRRYLTRIAKGLLIDRYRRSLIEAAYLESLQQMDATSIPDEETRLIIIETLTDIDTMLNKLPGNIRAALLMRQIDGLSYQAIAQQLNVSVSSVEKYVARGLAACYLALQAA